jgi:hypothetical protein
MCAAAAAENTGYVEVRLIQVLSAPFSVARVFCLCGTDFGSSITALRTTRRSQFLLSSIARDTKAWV